MADVDKPKNSDHPRRVRSEAHKAQNRMGERKRRANLKKNGLCKVCMGPVSPGHVHCDPCLAKRRAQRANRKKGLLDDQMQVAQQTGGPTWTATETLEDGECLRSTGSATPFDEKNTCAYNVKEQRNIAERCEHSAMSGPPESRCPQWPHHSLDYGQSLINGQSPSPSNMADGPRSCRLSGSLPNRAQHTNRGRVSGEANLSTPNPFLTVAPWQGSDGVDPRRIARGQRIAASTPIAKTEDGWIIPSDTRPGVYYRIWTDGDGAHCSCPDVLRTCKHIIALWFILDRDPKARTIPSLASASVSSTVEHPIPASKSIVTIPTPMDAPATAEQLTYWQAYNLAQTNEKWLFQQLLHALCALVPEPAGRAKGRPPIPVRDLVFGEVFREYSGMSSRRGQSDIKEGAKDGYISRRYGYNTGTDFLNRPETTNLLRALIIESARPLQGIERVFAPDSTGFSTRTHGRWYDEKYSSEKNPRATYVKTHILIGVKSHIITSAAASVEPIADIRMLPILLQETRGAHFTVEQILADGAYLSEAILEWAHKEGIDIWVPFRINSRFHYDNSLWDKHLATFLLNQQCFAEHYHQRSQVESGISMVKAKYGASVRGKTPTSQVNNVLCKLLANNLYVLICSIFELGLEPEFAKIGALLNPA